MRTPMNARATEFFCWASPWPEREYACRSGAATDLVNVNARPESGSSYGFRITVASRKGPGTTAQTKFLPEGMWQATKACVPLQQVSRAIPSRIS